MGDHNWFLKNLFLRYFVLILYESYCHIHHFQQSLRYMSQHPSLLKDRQRHRQIHHHFPVFHEFYTYYLPQEKNVNSPKTVLEEALSAFDEYHQLEAEVERLQQEMMERTDYESREYQRLIEHLNLLNDRLAMMGGNSIEGEAERILVG